MRNLNKILRTILLPQLLHHRQRLQFWERGHMKTVIGDQHVNNPVTVFMIHLKEVHRIVVHAHQQLDFRGVGSIEEISVQRHHTGETRVAHVEVVTLMIIIHIGEETDES